MSTTLFLYYSHMLIKWWWVCIDGINESFFVFFLNKWKIELNWIELNETRIKIERKNWLNKRETIESNWMKQGIQLNGRIYWIRERKFSFYFYKEKGRKFMTCKLENIN